MASGSYPINNMSSSGIDMASETHRLARQACWQCRSGKRKCSKEQPACARCSKLLLKCDYDYEQGSSKSSPPAPSNDSHTTPQLQHAAKLLQAFSANSPKSAFPDPTIPSQVLDILTSNGESVPSVTSTFLRTIDIWLPVIASERYMSKLESMRSNNNVELANLLLSMYLVTRTPGEALSVNDMKSSLYFESKTLHTFLASSGSSSIEIVQAGLLISLYEQGHGMIEAAQITAAVCMRIATKTKALHRENSPGIQNTEFGRLWWGLVTLDRHLNQSLSANEIQLLTRSSHDGVPSMELPTDNEAGLLPPPILTRTVSGISAARLPTTRLGPFCRAAEAAHLLGAVLGLIAESTYTFQIDVTKAQELDFQLRALAMLLMQQAVNGWDECCAAIGLCLSALIQFHSRRLELAESHAGQEALEMARLALASAVRMVIDICQRFHMDVAFIDLPALPLPAAFCIYRAAIIYIQFAGEEFLNPEWKANMENMKGALAHFGKRWCIGKYYLELINVEIANQKSSQRVKKETTSTQNGDYIMTS